MKIAICSQDFVNHIAGPNVWLDRIVPELRKENIECVVLFTIGGRGYEYRYITSLRNAGVTCYVYEGLDYTEKKIRWIFNTIEQEKTDIFIPNFDITAYYAARWIREAGIPTVGILHSDDQLYRSILQQFMKKSGEFNTTALVCVSEYLEKLAREQNNDKIIIKRIPCGTPVPDEVAKNNNTLKLIYTGRIVEEQKRISEVVSALCKAVRNIPRTEAVIYGSGKAKHIDSVLRIIRDEGNGLPIQYGGRIESNEIQKKLLEGQVFVLLSDYEGLPISLMEAMACGLVPVCMNIRSGIPELVEDGITGLLIDNRGDDFIDAISRLKNDKGLWERLSKNAREKVETEYSIQSTAKKWINLFRELKPEAYHIRLQVQLPKQIQLPEINVNQKRWDKRWPGAYNYYKQKWVKIIGIIPKIF